jgi:hypothetical protein
MLFLGGLGLRLELVLGFALGIGFELGARFRVKVRFWVRVRFRVGVRVRFVSTRLVSYTRLCVYVASVCVHALAPLILPDEFFRCSMFATYFSLRLPSLKSFVVTSQ